MKDDYRYCDLHDRWERTAMAELGAPLPMDARSTQLFLALALSEVMNRRGNRTDAEIQGIISLAQLMAKNACYLEGTTNSSTSASSKNSPSRKTTSR